MDNFHLVKKDGVYKLKRENAQRASKVINSNKVDAIKKAKEFILKNGGGSLKIHKVNGRIQEERTYPKSKDPRQTKG